MTFVQLQVISSYTLLQSTTRLSDLVYAAKERGYKALALTDHNVLYGQVDFYKLCEKAGIQPIIGIQLDVKGFVMTERRFPMVLLAKDYKGYQRLMQLSTLRSQEDDQLLQNEIEKGLNHLIAITAGDKSEVAALLADGNIQQAKSVSLFWKNLVTEGDFYLGVHAYRQMTRLIRPLQQLSQEMTVPLVALNEVSYLNPDDQFSCQVLQAISNNEQIDTQSVEMSGERYLTTAEEAYHRFLNMDLKEAADETERIASKINIQIPLNQSLLPKYPVPKGVSSSDYLKRLCMEGLEARVAEPDSRYQERLLYELEVIHEMGFDDYFLIVWDVMAYARQVNILPGAGRGSAAGSLVAYVLSITHVDPIAFNLFFERFLNRERYNMPDIDLDFPDNRRDDVLRYVKKKYGSDHVAQIITFGTLAAKMSIRDTARVFGLTPKEAGEWSNAIPSQLGIRLKDAYKQSRKLQQLVEKDPRNQLLFETAVKIEGVPRHFSTHAAGVVISDRPLVDIIPLQLRENDLSLTQYPMGNVEEIGLLKMDFLGLKNLSILDESIQLAKEVNGSSLDIFAIPINDPETMALFRRSDTNGVFQFESAGIKNVLRKLGPENLEDLVAVNALYRPGPMEQIDTFISRKKGQQKIDYLHPDLEPILEVTYGIMVYQEQVMQVASTLAGFTLGEADILRRAIGKKEKAILDREKKHFVDGAVSKGYPYQTAEEIYHYIERFANYGFNRSHSVAYSYIAYQMAYMKTHYPAAFFAALLNSANPHSDKMNSYLLDVIKRAIKLTYPDINKSDWHYTVDADTIRMGLSAIKSLRRDFISHIIYERQQHGPYQDFIQFLRRLPEKWLKDDLIEALIYSGVFDSFGHTRASLLASLPGMLSSIAYSGNNIDLIQVLEPRYVEKEEKTEEELAQYEEQYLGYSLMPHPIEAYASLYKDDNRAYIAELTEGKAVRTMGLIREVKRIKTKKGDPMAFVTLTDTTGQLSLTLFPEQYVRFIRLLKEGTLVVVGGKYESKRSDNQSSLIVQNMEELTHYIAQQPKKKKRCFILLSDAIYYDQQFQEIRQLLKDYPGDCQVVIVDKVNSRNILLDESYNIDDESDVIGKLVTIMGEDRVVLQ